MKQAIVLISGGLDSFLTYLMCRDDEEFSDHEVVLFNVGYLQRNRSEESRALGSNLPDDEFRRIVRAYSPCYQKTVLTRDWSNGGDYHESRVDIIGRNTAFVTAAVLAFYKPDVETVIVLGSLQVGEVSYDNTQEWRDQMNSLIANMGAPNVRVIAPISDWTKSRVIAEIKRRGYDPDSLRSCYAGGVEPCGVCMACVDRAPTAKDQA